MSKKQKRRVKLIYENWHGMLKDPKNDRKVLMTYPLWQ